MTTQNTLKAGDIITIKKATTLLLVVRSEHVVSEDRTRGEAYWVDEIDCVEASLNRFGRIEEKFIFELKKAKSFYFEGGCMKGSGKLIKDSDVKVVGTSKLTPRITITYTVDKVKYHDGTK